MFKEMCSWLSLWLDGQIWSVYGTMVLIILLVAISFSFLATLHDLLEYVVFVLKSRLYQFSQLLLECPTKQSPVLYLVCINIHVFVQRADVYVVHVAVIFCIVVHFTLFVMHSVSMRVPYLCRCLSVVMHPFNTLHFEFAEFNTDQWRQSKPNNHTSEVVFINCMSKILGHNRCWALTQIITMAPGAPVDHCP